MIAWLLQKILGTKHERELKKIRPRVAAINDLEGKIKKLSDDELRAKTAEFKQKIENGATVDDLLIEAFAVCREGSRRSLHMRHFDVQLIGGMVLHRGAIAEMRTGEGKTLAATLPAYLNALEGKGVHIVTVNDYLARRDSEWMGKLYGFLGLTTGVVVNSQGDREKFAAYRCDITYGQNNEFGFDYLRDNMKYSIYECAQRPLHYAIVDEVDSILVDEARTPLIISGQGEASSELYNELTKIMPYLKKDEHYTVDEKAHSVMLTDEGIDEAEHRLKISNLYDPKYLEHLHVLQQSLRAHTLYKRDVNYIVTRDGKVNIIDEFTGRILAGRRWSDGLHQAVEAKEFVKVQEENRTMATITFQNLFRIYKKLAGMTGTAETEAEELHSIYKLDVVPIPTNKPVARKDYDDLVYKTEAEKFAAVVEEIADCVERGQPSLVGTVSVQKSEAISQLLTERKIKHEVLNAKQHEREAYIVAQAGRRSMVTVATNMAGRGTDIVLGGNPEMLAKAEMLAAEKSPADPANAEELEALTEKHKKECDEEKGKVVEAGGLHIIGTERHESRRIDNQLRGRAGRQGDPGSSRFFLSLEDDLMKIFAGDRVQQIMESLGMEDGVPIEHPWVTSSVENAQKKVEARNFDIRKNLLDYDDVMNQQRKAVYLIRREVLEGNYGEALKDAEGEEREPNKLDEETVKRVKDSCENIVKHFPVKKDELAGVLEMERAGQQAPQTLPVAQTLGEMEGVNVYAVEQEGYRFFGVRVLLDKLADKPQALCDQLAEKVEWSLRLQRERVMDVLDAVVVHIVQSNADEKKQRDEWDTVAMANQHADRFGRLLDDEGNPVVYEDEDIPGVHPEARAVWKRLDPLGTREDMVRALYREAEKTLKHREKDMPAELQARTFRDLLLEEFDRAWVDHLTNMDHLRDGIGLRGYGQRDPKFEFKKEGFEMYKAMVAGVYGAVMQRLFHMQVQRPQDLEQMEAQERARQAQRQQSMKTIHLDASNLPEDTDDLPPDVAAEIAALLGDPSVVENVVRRKQPKERRSSTATAGDEPAAQQAGDEGQSANSPPPESLDAVRRAQPKVGRNDPCPCGSGKKYKKCHGATEGEAAT